MRIGLCLVVLSFSSAAFAHDVVDELERVPGLSIVEEQPALDALPEAAADAVASIAPALARAARFEQRRLAPRIRF